MFSRTAAFVLAFAALATATPAFKVARTPVTTTVTVTPPTSTSIPASQCNTGDLQCCNSVQTGDSAGLATIFGLLGIVLQDVTALVGVTCSPLSVIGVGGNSCSAQPVCCQNNDFHGLVALGCTPVNLNL